MPTNFPTSVDNFTNPTANDSLNLPSHSTQHANANDAIEAIEGYLLTGAGAAGLVKIIPSGATGGTVAANGDVTIGSAVSSVAITGAFSTDYENYKIIISGGSPSANGYLNLSLTGSATGYSMFMIYGQFASNTVEGAGISNVSNWNYAGGMQGSQYQYMNCELMGPFLAKYTRISSLAAAQTHVNSGTATGVHAVATSYTGFTVAPSTGTLTGGTIRVYGYK